MSNLAQEEADRYFSHRETSSSHPEDRDHPSDIDSDEDKPAEDTLDKDPAGSDSDADEDSLHKMSTLTATKTTFHIPSTVGFANTGPKGVIADARSFARAKQSTFRQRFASITTLGSKQQPTISEKKTTDRRESNSDSDLSLSEEETDSDFMNTWRAKRFQELSTSSTAPYTRRVSPSRRVWGALVEVDANGYLDAIEKVSSETVVVVLIFDPSSTQSAEVEDELSMMAYKHSTTRFVKLHYEIAEMETIEIPAILAYKQGDVFATISGVKADGLEGLLRRHKMLE